MTIDDEFAGRPDAAAMQRPAPRAHKRRLRALLLAVGGALLVAGFLALGTWQLVRLQWKLELIERVDQRVHAPAVAAPGAAFWPQVNTAADEYRRVRLSGTYLYEATTRVQAVTELGSGFWLLTPLRQADGSIVLVNRGFIPGDRAHRDTSLDRTPAGSGPVNVTGLLRMSEQGRAFLRHNDPANERWYSRDVAAIAQARHLSNVAPYFVDADATAKSEPGAPVGGLTVIQFHNNHLVYALTWYALALMAAGGCYWVGREERKRAREGAATESHSQEQ